jgi:hypothetical protein
VKALAQQAFWAELSKTCLKRPRRNQRVTSFYRDIHHRPQVAMPVFSPNSYVAQFCFCGRWTAPLLRRSGLLLATRSLARDMTGVFGKGGGRWLRFLVDLTHAATFPPICLRATSRQKLRCELRDGEGQTGNILHPHSRYNNRRYMPIRQATHRLVQSCSRHTEIVDGLTRLRFSQ